MEYEIENSKCEKLLGVKLDWQLHFDEHFSDVCKRASEKLNALARIAPFIRLSKRRMLINAFFYSKFSYCFLIWICPSFTNNIKINRLHEICLRIISKQSLFSELPEKDGSISIRMRNTQFLVIEMFCVSRNISPLSWMILSNKRTTVAITLDKFLNFQDRWWSQYTTEAKVFHF